MGGRLYLKRIFVIFFLLFAFHSPTEGVEEDLFSKIKITAIKGDKRAPDISLTDLNGKKVGLKSLAGKNHFYQFLGNLVRSLQRRDAFSGGSVPAV